MPAKHIGQLCGRCKILEADLTARSEALCRECFSKYFHHKIAKSLAGSRTTPHLSGQTQQVLVPISFGPSSLALLDSLVTQQKAQQAKSGRVVYALNIVHIVNPLTTRHEDAQKKFNEVQARFPGHRYSLVSLASIYDVDQVDLAGSDEIYDASDSNITRLEGLMGRLSSNTASTDVTAMLRTRLVARVAQAQGCDGVFWGHSTTRLAEQVIGETAKGRGFSLAWQVSDGESPYGPSFYYPMRDLLKKEIIAFSGFTSPPLTALMSDEELAPTQAPASSKNTTIDTLMRQYFESVEETYPSIVANVVRTSNRLQASKSEGLDRCRLCALPITEEQKGIHGWGGDQGGPGLASSNREQLCYGCTRSIPIEVIPFLPPT